MILWAGKVPVGELLAVFFLFSFNASMLTAHRQVGSLLTEQRKTCVCVSTHWMLSQRNGKYTKSVVHTSLSLCRFYSDNTTWTVDRQFLWGKHLLITPVLDPVSQHPEHIHTYGPSNTCDHSKCTCMYCIVISRLHILHAVNIEQVHWVDLQMMQMRVTYTHSHTHTHTPWPPVGKHDMGFSLLPSPRPSFFSLSYPPSFLSALMRALTSLLAD